MSTLGASVLTSLSAMGTTFRNFFRRANTIQYPKVSRPIPGRWRGGSFALTFDSATNEENCIGCRLCEYICPSQIIAVKLRKGDKRENGVGATYAETFTLDYQACMQCELCVQVCPTDAIVMTRFLHGCPRDREGLFLSKERLEQNGRRLLAEPLMASAVAGTQLREWTDAKRGVPPQADGATPDTETKEEPK